MSAWEVFDALVQRGEIVVHAQPRSKRHRTPLAAIGRRLTARLTRGTGDQLAIADTREQVAGRSTPPSATTATPPSATTA